VELGRTDAVQEVAKKELPVESESLNFDKGRLLMLLKKFVRSGRLAHGGRGAKAEAYNLDILKREYQKAPPKPG